MASRDRSEQTGDGAGGGPAPDPAAALYFRFFNEIGIINQLATAVLEAHLPAGLLAPHFTLLNHLVRVEDGRTPLALARAFQVPKTTMTHQVGVLHRRGLVALGPNPDDGRSKRVWLTEAGRALRARVVTEVGGLARDWSDAIGPDAVAAVLPTLERIRIHLDTHRAP